MFRFDPLDLTKDERAIVEAAASAVPPQWRERFLAHVGDALAGRSSVSTADIGRVVADALARMSPSEDSYDDCCGG
jgi:hypothetical protein